MGGMYVLFPYPSSASKETAVHHITQCNAMRTEAFNEGVGLIEPSS